MCDGEQTALWYVKIKAEVNVILCAVKREK